MSRDHTIRGIRYYDCDLCGITYRWNETQLNSAGLRVCKDHDVDEGEYRHPVFAAVSGVVISTAPPVPYATEFYENIISQGFWDTISTLTGLDVVTGGYDD